MSLRSITLVFENCESVEIPESSISAFGLSGISMSISYDSLRKSFRKYRMVSGMVLSLKDFSEIYTTLEDNIAYRVGKCSDITSISINSTDGESNTYHIEWLGDDDYNNPKQTHSLSKDYLRIDIG